MGPRLRGDDSSICGDAVGNTYTLYSYNELKSISGTVVLAGAGKMGGAMLSGWLARGLEAAHIVVIEPQPSDDLRAHLVEGVRLNASPQEIADVAAFVIALKPQAFRDASAGMKSYVGASTLVVSIMAGITIASVEASVGGNVVRAMPNTPAAVRQGVTVACPGEGGSTPQRVLCERLL